MSNRLAIDPSEIPIPDYAGIKRRLWARSPSPFAADPAPVVKVVEVDFGFNTPVEPRKAAALVAIDSRKADEEEAARKREKAEIIRRNDALIDEWLAQYQDRIQGASPRAIIASIANKHGVSVGDIVGRSCQVRHITARQEVMYEIRRQMPFLSSIEIASFLGNRDSSTIRHGIHAHAKHHGLPVPASTHVRSYGRGARADGGLAPVVRS